jgi:hypothetical protein
MPIIYITAMAVIIAFNAPAIAADPKYMMPRELVQYAKDIGCSQVEDFFDVEGMIGPPYVYGYLVGRPEDSAAFWCEKKEDGERTFFLAIKVQPGKAEGPLGCPRLIASKNYPGGLELHRNPNESLEEFRYVDSPNQKGPRGTAIVHNAIKSSVPGTSTTFYCQNGRWLIRLRH